MQRVVFILFFLLISCSKYISDPGFGDGNARFSVYFNDPGRDEFTMVNKFIDLELVRLIDEANESVLLAVYNFNKQTIIDAVLRARLRNIEVKVVGDVDEFFTHGYQQMAHFNIDMSLGNPSGIQHNKFAVVDNRYVFTGTGNLSDTDMERNNNNWYIIESPEMAEYYKLEFMQMYYGLFAAKKRPRSLNNTFVVNNYPVEVYFSPYQGQDAMDRLIELVNSAEHSVHYMIFAHTHDELASAMIYAARQRNIPVYGIHDNTFVVGVSEEAPRIYSAAINNDGSFHPTGPFPRWDGNENTKIRGNPAHGGKMHCKTLIIDAGTPKAKMATGSFNWSNNAINNNDENMIVIHNPKIANAIFEQFQQAWAISNDLALRVGRRGHVASARRIVISEIGWAGSATTTSLRQNDDFIEIYNPGPEPIDLSHWAIAWGPQEWRNIYPVPDRHNWYYENKQSCPGFPQFAFPQDNVICPGMYRVFYADGQTAYAPPSEDEDIVYNEDGAALFTRTTGLEHFRISGVKNFRLNPSGFKVRLFDKAMNLIDEAGTGDFPPAGVMDIAGKVAKSMERRAHQNLSQILDGKNPAAWFTAVQKYDCAHWSESFDSCLDANAGETYASAGKNYPALEPPKIRKVELISPTELNVYFTSHMSNCVNASDITVGKISGSGAVPSSFNIIPLLSQNGIKIIATSGNFNGTDTLFSLTPQTTCLDYLNTQASNQPIVFNGYASNLASVRINKVNYDTNWVEIVALNSGSVRGLKLYYYDATGMLLVHELNELFVQANETIVVSTRRSEGNLAKNEDKFNANGCDTGFSSPTCTIGPRNGSPFHINSLAPSLTATDAVLILTYCGTNPKNAGACGLPNYGVQDVVYYSDRDGTWASGFAEGALREVYEYLQDFWPLSEKPLLGYNDLKIQREGICIKADSLASENALYNCANNCKGVARVDWGYNGKNSWRCETILPRAAY